MRLINYPRVVARGFRLFSLLASFAILPHLSAQDVQKISLKLKAPQTPIVQTSQGEERATLLQKFDVDATPSSIVATVSEPKYLSRLEARLNGKVVASFDAAGVFDSDSNRPTNPTQIPLFIESDSNAGGELSIWGFPSKNAAPDVKIDFGIQSVSFEEKKIYCQDAPLEYRFATLVRDSGWDNVAQYRIPGIVKTPKGTLVAVYDARWRGFPDLPADIDVMCSRSFDNGKTWTEMKPVVDFDGEDPAKEGAGDPAILVDPANGRLWVAALWAHEGKGLLNSEPGLKSGSSPRLVLAYSDDEGETWSKPLDITNDAAPNKDWKLVFQGPGNGIVLRDGTLVFPAQFIDSQGVFYSTLLWSKDHGETWNVGKGAHPKTCEAQVVQLKDDSLMLNMRHLSDKFRAVAVTRDLGETWQEHSTSGNTLIEPVCQGSLLLVKSTAEGDDSDLLAFANPKSQKGRVNLTVRLSEDEGKTWTHELTIYCPGSLGYSCLVKMDEGNLGIFYETSGGLLFQQIGVADIPLVAE